MHQNWRDEITDPDELKVFEALSDPKYDFRTMNGIKKTSGLSVSKIKEILIKYRHLIRESPIRNEKNQKLYTLISRKKPFNEFLNIIIGASSKST
jgi:hypothetical protein